MKEKVKGVLLKILGSPRGKRKNWFRWKLIKMGVKEEFAEIIASRSGAETLLNFDPKEINDALFSLYELGRKFFNNTGRKFSNNTSFRYCWKIGLFQQLGLPVNWSTIDRNPKTLLRNKKELERLGLPVNAATIKSNPQTLLKNKKELERLGLSVNSATISNPKRFFQHKPQKS